MTQKQNDSVTHRLCDYTNEMNLLVVMNYKRYPTVLNDDKTLHYNLRSLQNLKYTLSR